MFIYLKPSLCLSFLFFAFCQLGADSNSSKNSEGIEKKPLNTKNKNAEKTSEKKIEKPETISPEKKNMSLVQYSLLRRLMSNLAQVKCES